MLSLFAPASLAVNSSTLPEFPNYVHFVSTNPLSLPKIGCFQNGFGGAEAQKLVCDGSTACHFYDASSFMRYSVTSATDTYLRVTGGAAACTNLTGGCSASPQKYSQCAGDGISKQNEFQLPPFLCEQTCSSDDTCIGFMMTADGQTCTTLKATPAAAAGGTYAWKFPPAATKGHDGAVDWMKKVEAPRPTFETALPTESGFQLFNWDMTEPVTTNASEPKRSDYYVFGQCPAYNASAPDPNYDPSLMSLEALTSLCAAAPTVCSHIGSAARAGGYYETTKLQSPSSTGYSTYVNTAVCAPVTAQCGAKFLKCPSLDSLAAYKPLGHSPYDLSADIMAQACKEKGCHFFTMSNSNTGGSLYIFTAAPGSNTTAAVDSYLLLP